MRPWRYLSKYLVVPYIVKIEYRKSPQQSRGPSDSAGLFDDVILIINTLKTTSVQSHFTPWGDSFVGFFTFCFGLYILPRLEITSSKAQGWKKSLGAEIGSVYSCWSPPRATTQDIPGWISPDFSLLKGKPPKKQKPLSQTLNPTLWTFQTPLFLVK